MKQLGLPDMDKPTYPTPISNYNRDCLDLDWIKSGYRPTKKLRHKNLSELSITEAKLYDQVTFVSVSS